MNTETIQKYERPCKKDLNIEEYMESTQKAIDLSNKTGLKFLGDYMIGAFWETEEMVREGFSRKDDRIPPRWLEPLRSASGEEIPLMGCEGKVVSADDVDRLLDDYYEERGWDIKNGVPLRDKLVALGLTNVATDLQRLGILK